MKRFILWDFARASWQYDVMVAIILAFIFLTPREWFRDQARIPNASSVAILAAEQGSDVFYVDQELLAPIPEGDRLPRLSEILTRRTGRKHNVTRIQPIYDEAENELKGYMAFATTP